MKLIDCSAGNWDFIRKLRNDREVQAGFIESKFITKEMQSLYMMKNHMNYKICLIGDVPCGYVGVIDNDIRICTHPDYQKKGVGLFMLKKIIDYYPDAIGKVKLNNKNSIKLFYAAGFIVVERNDDFLFFEYQLLNELDDNI